LEVLEKKMKVSLRLSLAAVLCICVVSFFARSISAQSVPGVTEKEIVIGSCSALEGPSKFLGTQTVAGARAYFESINEQGGVHGRKLRLIASDDSYDPAKAEDCFKHLQTQGVFAMGFFVGTPTGVKYVPLAETNKIPLVGLFTGAQALYTPFRHWVVNVRAANAD
jgi:ABC-type branched-subunit amino acid transport system substrate-binding protein